MQEAQPTERAFALDAALSAEYPRLVRLCRRLSGDADAAEDLAQETLIEAWRHAGKLTDPTGCAPWLAAIARNVCLRWRRRQGQEAAHLLRPPHDSLGAAAEPAAETNLERDLERGELATLLDRAIALLPKETRRVLVDRYIEELPQAEVAARLGLSEGAVAVRLHRGKLAIRKLLATELRDEAAAFGLAAPATDGRTDGWEETRIWCLVCGQRRLLGKFRPDMGELALRCPQCHTAPGENELDHISHVGLFQGIQGYKPAFSRVLRWANDYYRRALIEGSAPCQHCWRPAPLRMGFPANRASPSPGWRGMHVACAACDYPDNNSSVEFLALGLPEGRRFWREHPRIRALPVLEVEAQGRAALMLSFESVTGPAQLDVVLAHDNYDVLGVRAAPGG